MSPKQSIPEPADLSLMSLQRNALRLHQGQITVTLDNVFSIPTQPPRSLNRQKLLRILDEALSILNDGSHEDVCRSARRSSLPRSPGNDHDPATAT